MKKIIILCLLCGWLWSMGQHTSSAVETAIQELTSIKYYTLYLRNQDISTNEIIMDKEARTRLLQFCRRVEFPVNTLYLEVADLKAQSQELQQLIKQMHANRIKVLYLASGSKAQLSQTAAQVISFNIQSEDLLDGIIFDFNRSQSNDTKLQILQNTKVAIAQNKSDLSLGMTYYLDAEDQDIPPSMILLMNYVNFVSVIPTNTDPDEIHLSLQPLLEYAQELNTAIDVTLQLTPDTLQNSLGNSTDEYLKKYSTALLTKLQDSTVFRSLALNNYEQALRINNIKLSKVTPPETLRVTKRQPGNITLTQNAQEIAQINLKNEDKNIILDITPSMNLSGEILTAVQINLSQDPAGMMRRPVISFALNIATSSVSVKPSYPEHTNPAAHWNISYLNNQNTIHLIIPRSDILFDPNQANYFRLNIGLTTAENTYWLHPDPGVLVKI